jgi:hypothetical protein
MFTQAVWWAGIALQILLLVRAAQEKLAKKFPLFYSYLTWVLLVELLCFYIYQWQLAFYPQVYWPTEFLSVIVGYGVILEIYRRALINHPGVARLSQTVLLMLLFVTIAKVAADTFSSPLGSWTLATAELGRDLRYVQGALLIAILGLFGYYRIPAGRNLRGLIWGYGFFIGTGVINLAIRSQRGNEFSLLMQRLQPLIYLVALIIWSVALWSNQPEPRPDAGVEMERNYQALAAQTRMLLARAFAHVVRSMRA